MKTKRLFAWILTLAMVMSLLSGVSFAGAAEPTVTQSDTKENTNQAGGIIYTKTSAAKSDGTIDITLTAHTTGVVRQLTTVSPTDIVLVLDVSGSMDESYTTTRITGYNAATGREYTYTTGWWLWQEEHTAYGLESTSGTYYINTGTGEEPLYTHVTYTGRDSNGFEMYEYSVGNTEVVVYPILSGNISAVREYSSYGVEQFYSAETESETVNKMESLQNAVNAFIDTTAQMNEGLDEDEMHTISIVKFADDSYYQSSVPTIATGNNKGAGGNNSYNYSQVVKNLTPVDADGATELKTAVNSLDPGGATAVDYGLNLAEAVLMNRSAVTDESAVDRNEVIIVFTDGEPNHQNGFDTDVANDAIELAGDMKRVAGVTIYGVCIAEGADATDSSANINKFMHYVSSNYPNATSMTSTGTGGGIDRGYYMTPDDSTSLMMIFESIIESIDHPTITMGEEASMVDTVSPYFDFVGSATDVKLQTRDRIPDGNGGFTWAEQPVDDSSLSCNIAEDRLTVDGFDFDANYVSETGRGENGDFYGKQLVVSFTVVPNYDAIDAASATLMEGILPTNTGFASLVDSDSTAAAEVTTPELSTHQVTYKVEGVNDIEDVSYNRFTGSQVEVDAEPQKEGYTFSGWMLDGDAVAPGDTFTMPDEDVEIIGTFTANEYNVKYLLDGYDPGATLPADKEYPCDSTVQVKDNLEVSGYTFSGWYTDDVTVEDGEFTMPAHEVVFYGSFEPADVEYKVEYYFENLEGETDPSDISDYTKNAYNKDGTVGTDVGYTASGTFKTIARAELETFEGFTLNRDGEMSKISGEVTIDEHGEGNLVLKLYYQRNRHKVSYRYVLESSLPTDVDPSPADLEADEYTKEYKYGARVDVKPDATASNYEFIGWTTNNVTGFTTDTTFFEMPDNDVQLRGYFNPEEGIPYTIEHYLQNETLNGYVRDDNNIVEFTGTQGETITIDVADADTYLGFDFVENHDENVLSGLVDGTTPLKLKLYYNRKLYNVSYEFVNRPVADEDMPTLPEEDYPFGADVEVDKTEINIPGYTFSGWDTEDATIVDGRFTMPAHNVVLRGRFSPAPVVWKEEHYLQNAENANQYDLDTSSTGNITHHNMTGDDVTVNAGHYPGFGLNESRTNEENTKKGLPQLDNNHAVKAKVLNDGSLVVQFYYDRNPHNVSYEFVNRPVADEDMPTLPAPADHLFGTTVRVDDREISIPGYTFSGWDTEDATIVDGEFTMPDHDVVLKGSFTAKDVEYTVNYWFQNLDAGNTFDADKYTLDTTNSYTRQAYVGQHVEADPIDHTGFYLNSNSTTYGHIPGEGKLVLNVYFDRHVYNVTYAYYGEQPDGADQKLTEANLNLNNVKYGAPITVGNKLTLDGYAFDGWYTRTATVVDNKFTMPAHDVTFLGRFVEAFTVEYDLNGGTGAEGVDYNTKTVTPGTVITVNVAPTRSGYTFTGWKEGASTTFNPGDTVTVDRNITLVAQWRRNGGGNPGGGGGVTRYTLTYETNGGSSIAKETYTSGTTVKLTKAPTKSGYVFEGWYEDAGLTKSVEEVKMTKNITVYARWVEDNGSAGSGYHTPDSLNGEDHFAYVIGYPDGTVRPNDHITRAEVTAIFFRLLKPDEIRDKNLTSENSFTDVNAEDWHNTSVSTMAKLGIVNGRTAKLFAPDADITRAEFAAICARFDDSKFEVVDDFTDVKGHWAEADIHEAAAHGWIKGYEDHTFKPDQLITRAEAMTMINRVLNRVPETADDLLADMIKWPDNSDASVWYYLPVQEATNSHDYSMKNHIYEKWTTLKQGTDWMKYQ